MREQLKKPAGCETESEVFTRWGWIVAPSQQIIRRPAYGYNIRRSTLDPILRKTAAQTVGVEFFPGFSARELLVDQGRICGASAQGEGDARLHIEARLVVGADGRNSGVAELAGLPAKEAPNGRIFYFAHYRNLPLVSGTRSQLWFMEPDIAYTFPNDDDVTLATAMPARNKTPQWKKDPEAAMTRLFEDLPRAPSLAKAVRATPFMGMIEYPNLHRNVSKLGLALIGDAALSIDPLWGVGCGWALQSAEWLAGAIGRKWTSLDGPRPRSVGLCKAASIGTGSTPVPDQGLLHRTPIQLRRTLNVLGSGA